MNVKKPVWFPGWLFLWLRSSKDETESVFYYFVMHITKMLIG
ncbi:hypothetical protein H650_15135 [Enterobacter sp. R4-368]|nr:hypothetical protein H650_15135 [Enterobacter sp. R4-368]